MLGKNLIQAASGAGGGEVLGVEDVFSTWLYTGNGSTQVITNGIDLAGEGGMVWVKSRSGTDPAQNHNVGTTDLGTTGASVLKTNMTSGVSGAGTTFTAFNTDGFSVGDYPEVNADGTNFVSWTFRKAAKFFDVVTYVGDNTAGRTIAHNLGSTPGFIIIKNITDGTVGWYCYHRSLGASSSIVLNQTTPSVNSSPLWNSTAPTSSVFTLTGNNLTVNQSGSTYVAYLFAHDAGGFGEDGTDNVISCGSYTGTSAAGLFVNLGWEPQWVLIKNTTNSANWIMLDTMRGIITGSDDNYLVPNTSGAEGTFGIMSVEATGFTLTQGSTLFNATGNTYIYIAIRRGPMKTPTSGTEVFNAATYGQNSLSAYYLGAVTDLSIVGFRAGSTNNAISRQRLTGANYIITSSTAAEVSSSGNLWDNMYGFQAGGVTPDTTFIGWQFRRAPGFMDVVAYTGTGSARTVSHNLGVVPELMIVKVRDTGYKWIVYSSSLGNTQFVVLNETTAATTSSITWNDTTPTSSVFTLGTSAFVNGSGNTYIAYLFATLPGISKVFNYTGTGTTLQVDCGFTSGARFVLIKRTDSTGSWYVWDTARGITSSSDPYLLLNSTAAEVTGTDYIDPYSAGFEISSSAPAEINASGGSYIGLAIA